MKNSSYQIANRRILFPLSRLAVYLVVTCLTFPVLAAKPEGERCQFLFLTSPRPLTLNRIFDGIYWWKESFKLSDLGSLHAELADLPKARRLAVELNLPESAFSEKKGLAGSLAFYARAGQILNSRGMSPMQFLKDQSQGNPQLLHYLSGLENEANKKHLQIEWQEAEVESSSASLERISIFTRILVDPRAFAAMIIALRHELMHEIAPAIVDSRQMTDEQFVERHLTKMLEDELRVRLAERETRDTLLKMGIPVPADSLTPLTLTIWSAQDRHATHGELFAIVAKDYEYRTTVTIIRAWHNAYAKLDKAELLQLLEKTKIGNAGEFKESVAALLRSSLPLHFFSGPNRVAYLKHVVDEAKKDLGSNLTPLTAERLQFVLDFDRENSATP